MARSIIGSLWNPAQRNELNRMLEELYSDLGTATGTKNKIDNFLDGTGVVSKKMLASDSVDGTKIEDSTIFSNHMRIGAIGERELATGGVTSTKIRNGAVSEIKLEDGGVSKNKIADGAVTNLKIADYSVTNEKLGLRSVSTDKLDYQSVTLDRLSDSSVSTIKLLNGAVTRSKLEDSFMYNERVQEQENMDTLAKEGTYIINANNIGAYPNADMKLFICTMKIERFEGWVHQTINRLEKPDTAYKRWVGTSSGTVSDWEKVHIGIIDGKLIENSSVQRYSIADNAISSVKILDGAGFRRKLSDDFMYGGTIPTSTPMETLFNDGTYIISSKNSGVYPIQRMEGLNCAFKIESYQSGWIHQTISPLNEPENKFVRWVGKTSGTVSEWKRFVTKGENETTIKPLKIFMVGNSFALDICDYLHHMCADAKVDITIGVTYLQNANLESHLNNLVSGDSVYNYHEYTSIDGVASKTVDNGLSLQNMLIKHDDWNFVTFQQQSTLSDDYSTYQPFLNDLINGIKNLLSNSPEIGMVQTWANSTSRRPDQQGMYNGLVGAYEQAIIAEDIGVFIPAGTAIQSARTNAIMNEEADELTRDGYHLSPLGKYIAGLTMFESLFSGYFKRDLLSDIKYQPDGVTNYQMYKAKLAAKNAVMSPMKFIEL